MALSGRHLLLGKLSPTISGSNQGVLCIDLLDPSTCRATRQVMTALAHEQLTDELGEAAARAAVVEASMTLDVQPYSGHVLAVATRI